MPTSLAISGPLVPFDSLIARARPEAASSRTQAISSKSSMCTSDHKGFAKALIEMVNNLRKALANA